MSEDKYVVAVAFSKWSLMEIFDFMADHLEAKKEQIGAARIDRYKAKGGEIKESNRTIMLIERELFQEAVSKDLNKSQTNSDFKIAEYTLNDRHFPNENQKANLYLNFPNEIPVKDIELQLKDKLKTFKDFGLLKGKYRIVIPLKSRETGENHGFGYVNFTDDDLKSRALIKVLLHDSRLYNDKDPDNRYYLKAYWTKDKK